MPLNEKQQIIKMATFWHNKATKCMYYDQLKIIFQEKICNKVNNNK